METWASAACQNFSIPSPSFLQTTCFSTATEPVPVAWFESQDIFLSDTATGTSAIEREFQGLIILLSSVYNNYKGSYAQQGDECVLDLLIKTSLTNLITSSNLKTERSIEDIKAFEYDREKLIEMAQIFIKR